MTNAAFIDDAAGPNISITSISFELTQLALRGQIVGGVSADSVQKTLKSWLELIRTKRVALNMADVSRIDKNGLMVLVTTFLIAKMRNVQFALTEVPQPILEKITAAGFQVVLLPGSTRSPGSVQRDSSGS